MKVVVAYDSVHGSTRQVAEAIAGELGSSGDEVEVISVKERGPENIAGDILFIGSPTRGGIMTKDTARFIEGLDIEQWKGKSIIAFDTLGPLSKNADRRRKTIDGIKEDAKTAASSIRNAARRRGLTVHPLLLHFAVVGLWGPLAPDAQDLARTAARRIVEEMG